MEIVTFSEYSSSMQGGDFLDRMASDGRYTFTTVDAVEGLGASPVAARAALRRLKEKGKIATPFRGFHVIVPPEYRRIGCLPAEQFVPDLIAHVEEDYYAGLLSAARYHGAGHHAPQEFQVVVARNRTSIECGKVKVSFVARRNVAEVPVQEFNTPRGILRVSTPEATAFDLVGYPQHSGGLDNVATVLAELAERLDPAALVAAAKVSPLPWAQRLGFLLGLLGAGDRTRPLARFVEKRATHERPLDPGQPKKGVPREKAWRVAVNVEVAAET